MAENDLEARADRVDADLTSIKIDLGVLKATTATKSDLSETKTSIILWVVSAVILAQMLPSLLKFFG